MISWALLRWSWISVKRAPYCSSPSIPPSLESCFVMPFGLALLAAIDIISHIIFHLLHVPLQPQNRTIPYPSLSRTGGDNVADRRLYEAINSFYQPLDADGKAGYPILVREPWSASPAWRGAQKGLGKEQLCSTAAVVALSLVKDFSRVGSKAAFADRSGLCKCATPPLPAPHHCSVLGIVLGSCLCATNGPMGGRSRPKAIFPSMALLGSVKKSNAEQCSASGLP